MLSASALLLEDEVDYLHCLRESLCLPPAVSVPASHTSTMEFGLPLPSASRGLQKNSVEELFPFWFEPGIGFKWAFRKAGINFMDAADALNGGPARPRPLVPGFKEASTHVRVGN
jgi:hypothetical protein